MKLDRIPWHDPASRAYGITEVKRAPLPPLADLMLIPRAWRPGPVLDQGDEGACTGFGTAGCQAATPQPWPGVSDAYARARYQEAREVDAAEGRNFASGATVLATVKAQVQHGRALRFSWAFTLQELLYGLLRQRPALFGVSWLSSMFRPSAAGLITVGGSNEGGHCLYGYAAIPAVRSKFGFHTLALRQSWGAGHGDRGTVYVRTEEWWELLRDQGETCFLVDRRP